MICPHCGKNTSLRESDQAEYARRKKANANASREKAKANGVKMGRKKKRDDNKIKALRILGFSIREIAFQTGVSTAAVQRTLND